MIRCRPSRMKTCKKCGKVKRLSSFYTNKLTSDGHWGKCKDCIKQNHKAYRQKLRSDPEWVKRNRVIARIRRNELIAKVVVLHSCPKAHARWRKKNKHKIKANDLVRKAFRKGLIQLKTECELCGVSKPTLHKHHVNYSEPLSVTFLCTFCHGVVHRKGYQGQFKPIPQPA